MSGQIKHPFYDTWAHMLAKVPGELVKMPGELVKALAEFDQVPGEFDQVPGEFDQVPGGFARWPHAHAMPDNDPPCCRDRFAYLPAMNTTHPTEPNDAHIEHIVGVGCDAGAACGTASCATMIALRYAVGAFN